VIGRSERRYWIVVDLALHLTLALVVLIAAVSGAVLATPRTMAGPAARAVEAAYGYDAASNTLGTTNGAVAGNPVAHAQGASPTGPSASGLRVVRAVFVAAEAGANAGAKSVDEVLGSLPKGNQGFVRTIPDESTLQSTFNDLTRGATKIERKGYDGSVYELRDGTQIGLRGSSTSGAATIDTRGADGSINKIHIG
jgi:hypothetical protein